MIALTTVNWLTLAGIVVGTGGFIGAFVKVYQAKPQSQTLVMSTGETGVKILDGVIDTLQSELARRDVMIDRYMTLLDARDERIRELVEMVRDARTKHISELERELQRLQEERDPSGRRQSDRSAELSANHLRRKLRDLRAENGHDELDGPPQPD